jgi:2-phospho-L-lactate transferase/gluconeogenesis factor (CofD/UPF0052 family)
MVNIVSFNGGRGAKNLIPSFLGMDGINLTSIVNAYDDGKSTGEIRSFFKMLGPSDIRKVQEAMIPEDLEDHAEVLKIFEYRFPVDARHDNVTGILEKFALNESDALAGIVLKDRGMVMSLRTCIQKLLKGIQLIEKAENKQLNFSDCSLMNLVYAGAYLHFGGNFEEATVFIDKLFKLKGTVLPTNNEDKKMVALREDGTILYSEAEIVELRANSRIKKIYLLDNYPDKSILSKMSLNDVEAYFEIMNRQVCVTSKVKRSISDADIIIYSAGTQHSSLYPSYITKGLTDAIAANKKALKVFIANIGEDYETPSYTASDLINGAIKYLRSGAIWNVDVNELIDVALVNNKFSDKKLENYIQYDMDDLQTIGCKILVDGFEDDANPGKHNGPMLSKYILDLYEQQGFI